MTHTNFLFLDMDGVLVTENSMSVGLLPNKMAALDFGCVSAFEILCDKIPNLKIVLSSSWRHAWSLSEIEAHMRHFGFTRELFSATPDLSKRKSEIWTAPQRGDEIRAWVKEHASTRDQFVILDDDTDMGVFLPKLVKTDFKSGFTVEHIAPALQILGVKLT